MQGPLRANAAQHAQGMRMGGTTVGRPGGNHTKTVQFMKKLAFYFGSRYTVGMKKYYVIPKLNIAVILSALLLAASAILRVIYYAGVRASAWEIWLQEVLPVCAGLWLLLMLFLCAGDRLYRTFLPVLLGLVFFAVKAASFSPSTATSAGRCTW